VAILIGPNGGPKQGYSGSRSRHNHGRPIVLARPARTAIRSSTRRAERVWLSEHSPCTRALACVHSATSDVEAIPSAHSARLARRRTGPRLSDGRAGLRDRLRRFAISVCPCGRFACWGCSGLPTSPCGRFARFYSSPVALGGEGGLCGVRIISPLTWRPMSQPPRNSTRWPFSMACEMAPIR
jgi:hypothetical protein